MDVTGTPAATQRMAAFGFSSKLTPILVGSVESGTLWVKGSAPKVQESASSNTPVYSSKPLTKPLPPGLFEREFGPEVARNLEMTYEEYLAHTDNVDRQLGALLREKLLAAGLDAETPFELAVDADKKVTVTGDDPRKGFVEDLFAKDPVLAMDFRLIANANGNVALHDFGLAMAKVLPENMTPADYRNVVEGETFRAMTAERAKLAYTSSGMTSPIREIAAAV